MFGVSASAIDGSRVETVGDEPERRHGLRRAEVLARVAYRDAGLGPVAACALVACDRARLRGLARDQVVRARALDGETGRPALNRPVVDQSQVAVAVLGEQRVGLERVDLAAEQVRDVAPQVPRVVVLEAPRVGLEQQGGRARLRDQIVDRPPVDRDQAAGQQLELAVEHERRARLVDERALAEQARGALDVRPPAAGEQHDLGAGARAGLQGPRAQQRERAVAVVQERAVAAEQRAVEVHVDAGEPGHATYHDKSWPSSATSSPGTRCSRPAGSTSGWSCRPCRTAAAPRSLAIPADLHPDVIAALGARRDRAAVVASGRGARGRLGRADDRHHRHRVRQVAVLQPADARRAQPRRPRRARSTSTRPRRSPRTRRARCTRSRARTRAPRSTTATRRASSARRCAGART